MRGKAYTLVELVIALAVIVVILGVGIPRYSGYLRQSRFTAEVQKVSRCVQGSQVAVAAPNDASTGTPARYGRASLAVSSQKVTGCTETLYPYGLTDITAAGAPQPSGIVPVQGPQGSGSLSGLYLCAVTVDGATVPFQAGWTSLDLYFDRLGKGTLWNLAYGGSGSGARTAGPMPAFGQGHVLRALLSASPSDCTQTATSTAKVWLSVPAAGTPIEVTSL